MNREYPDHPYRLSSSTLDLFHSCERKFQLQRLLEQGRNSFSNSAATVQGKSFGAGIQCYMITGNIDQAIYKAWLAYQPELEDRPMKSKARTLNNLWLAKEELDRIRGRYKIVYFKEKPAAELSFKLIIDQKWYYGGSIDLILYDTLEKLYVVWEVKTTGNNAYDVSPLYKNSGQALGYSIVLDQIVGAELARYGVIYFVCQDFYQNFIPKLHTLSFQKTLLDRLNWFLTLGYDYESIKRMDEFGIWPIRGSECFKYKRQCQFFNTCNTTAGDVAKDGGVDKTEYDFVYQLDEVIADHFRRIQT